MSRRKWVDDRYGLGGIYVWVLLACWFVVLYIISLWISRIDFFHTWSPSDLYFIDVFGFLGTIFIAFSFLLFLYQSIHAVEAIELETGSICNVRLFFGRKIKFDLRDIKGISSFYAKGVKHIYSPFESDKENYRIDLTDGKYVCVSGSLKGVRELINCLTLELERSRGQ